MNINWRMSSFQLVGTILFPVTHPFPPSGTAYDQVRLLQRRSHLVPWKVSKVRFTLSVPALNLSTTTVTYSTLFTAACDSIIELLNMEPLGGTETPNSPSVHTLQLSGLVIGGGKVLVRCRMTFSRGQGVTLELGVRAEHEGACALVVSVVGG
jgi:hypothetical protein